MESCEDFEEKIERGKRIEINPIDEASPWHSIMQQYEDQLIYVSSENEKYLEMISEFKKHPYKIIEYYSGIKLSLWQKIYFDTIGKLKKTDYEKQQIAINKAIRPYIKK